MKGLWGFLVLIFFALLMWAVVDGLRDLFGSVAATWTVADTAAISDALSQVLFFGGFVVVAIVGYVAWTMANKAAGVRFGGGSRPQRWEALPPSSANVPDDRWAAEGNASGWTNGTRLAGERPALPAPDEGASWYQLDSPARQEVRRD